MLAQGLVQRGHGLFPGKHEGGWPMFPTEGIDPLDQAVDVRATYHREIALERDAQGLLRKGVVVHHLDALHQAFVKQLLVQFRHPRDAIRIRAADRPRVIPDHE